MQMKSNERGGARLKFVIAIAVFAIVIYAGYLYLPVAVDAYYFKDVMQNKVDGAVTQGYEAQWVSDQLKKSAAEFHVPDTSIISPTLKHSRLAARLQFPPPTH